MWSTGEFTGTLSSGPGELVRAVPGELFSGFCCFFYFIFFQFFLPYLSLPSSFLPVSLLDSFSVFRPT